MTAAALVVYGVLLAAAVVAVFRRPVVALYLFVLGLPLHNIVMSLLYGGGVRGGALDAIQAWKEIVLAAALASVARRAPSATGGCRSARTSSTGSRSPTRRSSSSTRVIPQSALDGHAGARAIAYGLRHDLVFVAAYFLGRSVVARRPPGRAG